MENLFSNCRAGVIYSNLRVGEWQRVGDRRSGIRRSGMGSVVPDTTEGKAKRSEAEGLRLTLNNNKFYIL